MLTLSEAIEQVMFKNVNGVASTNGGKLKVEGL